MGKDDDLYSIEKCGSVMEGYGFFSVDVTGSEQDIDIMVSPTILSVHEDDIDVSRTPVGFVWVQIDELLQRMKNSGSNLLQILKKANQQFVSASAIYSHFLRVTQENFNDGDFDVVQNEPAITLRAKEINARRYGYMRVMDIAVALSFSGWPRSAVEWLNRESRDFRLLSTGTIQKIARGGCHLVYKPSGSSENSHLDWRFSFSKAEKTLLQYHSDKHALKLCYIMLRYAYKKHLKPRLGNKKILASYYLKTIFLWLAETDTGFGYHNLADPRLGALFELMINKVREAYDKHFMSHYFISHWNLLRDLSKSELNHAQDLLDDLSQNKKEYISYIQDIREYILPLAKQSGGAYNELLVIIDESATRHTLFQAFYISSFIFGTLIFVKCVLNALYLDIALCSV
ncbi:Protein mab-21-like 3 [Stylophora pistillata]|uniref:Protein mab-21-like 3 n=2 Tax=Stylophora pistillata TaxID=50429 RepID=A0A2B4RBI8_STYPI|nr:Protein mab-21-like 3 [Stylophora pistillata]